MYVRIIYDDIEFIGLIDSEYFFNFSNWRPHRGIKQWETYLHLTSDTDISAISYAQLFFVSGFRLSFNSFCNAIENLELQSINYNIGQVEITFSNEDFI